MREKIIDLWNDILDMQNARPYVFKTRLERTIRITQHYAQEEKNDVLDELCEDLYRKMNFISDQSNQTSDGVLRSYLVLKEEFTKVRSVI